MQSLSCGGRVSFRTGPGAVGRELDELRAARSPNVPGNVCRHLKLKQRQRGLKEASSVESFLVLNALGGDCLEDFEWLREDPGRKEMLGHEIPSPEAARKFLYPFHEAEKLEQVQGELPAGQVSYIPEESAPLRALAQVNQDLVRELARRCPDQNTATIDLDATVIESWKRRASHLSRRQRVISRCWRCGRNWMWRWPTSSATAMCRRIANCWG